MMKLIVPQECEHLAKMQVTNCPQMSRSDMYSRMTYDAFTALKLFLPCSPKKVLDLGCGLGRAAAYLNLMWNDPDIHYILADASCETPESEWKMNEFKQWIKFYNDFDATKIFAKMNGLVNFKCFDIINQQLTELSDIDLVISFLAIGFHWPIEDIIDDLCTITSPECTMIFSIFVGSDPASKKGNRYNIDSFKDRFNRVNIIAGPQPNEGFLILRDKKHE